VSADPRRQLLDRLSAIPEDIAAASRAALAAGRPEAEHEWPVRTVVLHLLAGDSDVWQPRLRQMAGQDNPYWEWTEPEMESWLRRFATYDLEALLDFYASVRRSTLAHLHNLSDAGWARVGTHAVYGVLDVGGVCRSILQHDEEHLDDLRKRANQ
jgi:hypothetical protein